MCPTRISTDQQTLADLRRELAERTAERDGFKAERDEALARHLLKCYWKELKRWERRGYTFEEVLPVALYHLCWTVIRNACTWLTDRGTLEHWARFWNTRNLTETLRRAINDLWASEGPRDAPLPENL